MQSIRPILVDRMQHDILVKKQAHYVCIAQETSHPESINPRVIWFIQLKISVLEH